MKKRIVAIAMTLAMAMSLLPVSAFAVNFNDTEDHWGKDSIDRWAEVGILNGKGDGVFDPDGSMTRGEFAQMLANMLGYTKKSNNIFGDVDSSAWYADAILKLAAAGVMLGDSAGNANPNAQITREEAAVMLCRAFNIPINDNASMDFVDAGSVSSWAKGAVATLAELGMMNGMGDNTVAPQLNINRASVATLVDNMVTEYVTESKTISGDVKGVVIVAGDVNVTVTDVTMDVPLVVAPKAEGAEVTLAGTTDVANVVVDADNAKVVVQKDAATDYVDVSGDNAKVEVAGTVDSVTVAGANTKVEVAGKAESVIVTETATSAGVTVAQGATVGNVASDASSATVTVAKDATVKSVAVNGANTKVDVNGTVSNVKVDEGANNSSVSTGSDAKIDNVTTSADNVKVTGTGKVDTVTADKGSVDVTVKDTEVKNEGADKVIAGDKNVETGDSQVVDKVPSTGGGGGGGGSTSTTDASVTKAIFHDTRNTGSAAAGTYVADDALSVGYSVRNQVVDGVTKVTITHPNIWQHQNAASSPALGYWTGFAVKAPTGATGNVQYAFSAEKSDPPSLTSTPLEDIDQQGTMGLAAYYNVGVDNSAKKYLAIQWPEEDTVNWFEVDLTGATARPIVSNAKTHVVKTIAEIDALNLPADSRSALLAADMDGKPGTTVLPEAPWLVVVYDRNVAEAITLKVTKGGTELSGATSTTSPATIGEKRVQAWAMSPVADSESAKLWDNSAIENATFSGIYGVSFTASGKNVSAETTDYTHAGEKVFTITFDAQNGTTATTQTLKENASVTAPTSNPEKSGYTFDGWYTAKTGGEKVTFGSDSVKATENKTYFAQWKATEYTITYKDGSESISNLTPTSYTIEADDITLPTPTKAGYKFAGWYDSEDKEVTTIEKGSTGNLELTAKWTTDAEIKALTDLSDFNSWEGHPDANKVTVTLGTANNGTIPVTGTLCKVDNFKGFNSAETREQSGWYAAIEIAPPSGTTGIKTDSAVIRVDNDFSANKVKVYNLTGDSDTLKLIIHVADVPEEGGQPTVGAKTVTVYADWNGGLTTNATPGASAYKCVLDFSKVILSDETPSAD